MDGLNDIKHGVVIHAGLGGPFPILAFRKIILFHISVKPGWTLRGYRVISEQ
jgi:hypothetical protein